MPMMWHNAEWKPQGKEIFRASDRMRLGDGFFDTMLAMRGELLHPDLHYKRLFEASEVFGIDMPLSYSEFHDTLMDLLARNSYLSSPYAINTVVTRGPAERGIAPPPRGEQEPHMLIRATLVPDHFDPIKAITATTTRRNEYSPLSNLKTLNYGDNVLAMIEAQKKGANDALMLNTAGRATCFTSGNLFIKLGANLVTPPLSEGVLSGVTRQIFMDQYDVTEQPVTIKMLDDAEVVFMTNSIRGASFIQSLDDRIYAHSNLQIDQNFHLKSNFKSRVNER